MPYYCTEGLQGMGLFLRRVKEWDTNEVNTEVPLV